MLIHFKNIEPNTITLQIGSLVEQKIFQWPCISSETCPWIYSVIYYNKDLSFLKVLFLHRKIKPSYNSPFLLGVIFINPLVNVCKNPFFMALRFLKQQQFQYGWLLSSFQAWEEGEWQRSPNTYIRKALTICIQTKPQVLYQPSPSHYLPSSFPVRSNSSQLLSVSVLENSSHIKQQTEHDPEKESTQKPWGSSISQREKAKGWQQKQSQEKDSRDKKTLNQEHSRLFLIPE